MSFQEKESLYCACQKTYMAALQQSELRMCQNTLALQALGHDERQKHCRYYIAAKHLMWLDGVQNCSVLYLLW